MHADIHDRKELSREGFLNTFIYYTLLLLWYNVKLNTISGRVKYNDYMGE